MTAAPDHATPPLLQRVPDARRAPYPLFDPLFYGYIAVMFGPTVGAACALYNAVGLRRIDLALEALVAAAACWLLFFPAANAIYGLGLTNLPLLLLLLRVVGLGVAAVLAARAWAHVRGHRLLDGPTIPLLWCVLVGFVLYVVVPRELTVHLLGTDWR